MVARCTRPRPCVCYTVEILEKLTGHTLLLIETIVDIEDLAKAEDVDLVIHQEAENLVPQIPDTTALGAMIPADVVETNAERDLADRGIQVFQDIPMQSFRGCLRHGRECALEQKSCGR